MKIKLVQDSIVFISGLTKEAYFKAMKFVPEACTLKVKDEETKKAVPVCAIAYAEEGSVSDNGIVFDSTTEDGFMCKTIVASQGYDEPLSAEEKVKAVSETFASLILKMNNLENQITVALEDNAAQIAAAQESVQVVNL